MPRHLTYAPVLAASRLNRFTRSRSSDFSTGRPYPVSSLTSMGPLIPYCLDIARQRSLYAAGVSPDDLRSAPFSYLWVRKHARSILSVPWENGALYPHAGKSPAIFVFSPGRVGSTLLHAVLNAADITSISEPDFYTQAADSPLLKHLSASARHKLSHTVAELTVDLVSCLARDGSPLVLKLRSQCCLDPDMLLSALPEVRTIFMIRNFADWAASSLRAFGHSPEQLVKRYLTSIRCYQRLNALGPCYLLHYDSLIARLEESCAGLSAFIGCRIDHDDACRASQADSQAGTGLDRRLIQEPRYFHEKLSQALRLWEPHEEAAGLVLSGGYAMQRLHNPSGVLSV